MKSFSAYLMYLPLAVVFIAFGAFLFYLGEYVLGVAALLATAAMGFLVRMHISRVQEFSVDAFLKNHPECYEAGSRHASCPKCGGKEQRCQRIASQTIVSHPFVLNTFDIKCAQCGNLLFVETASRFFSTFELAELGKPHRHRVRSFERP